jgi:hypothetical protein
MPTLAAAREYPLLGQNTTVSSNQAIRIYAAASVGMSQQTKGYGVMINNRYMVF